MDKSRPTVFCKKVDVAMFQHLYMVGVSMEDASRFQPNAKWLFGSYVPSTHKLNGGFAYEYKDILFVYGGKVKIQKTDH